MKSIRVVLAAILFASFTLIVFATPATHWQRAKNSSLAVTAPTNPFPQPPDGLALTAPTNPFPQPPDGETVTA